MLALSSFPGRAVEALRSPSGVLRVEFGIDGARPAIRAWYGKQILLESSDLGLELGPPAPVYAPPTFAREERRESWRPPYGEHAALLDHCNVLRVRLAALERGASPLEIEIRAYDHALAFRYHLPGAAAGVPIDVREDRTRLGLPDGTVGWAISLREEIHGAPVPLAGWTRGLQPPLTVRTGGGVHAAILEADARDFPRLRLIRLENGSIAVRLRGAYRGPAPVLSPWRVLLVGAEAADLIRHQGIVQVLNPPARGDFSWVRPGKVLSAIANFPPNQSPRRIETAHLRRLVDWAAEQRFRYLQLDWGWNGTEGPWTDAERAAYRERVPARFRDSGWEANTTGALDRVARGYVPFRPNPKTGGSDLWVDLDLPGLVAHGQRRGVGISLYVNSRWSLPSQDMAAVFALYERWGVAGLKPGFVHYGKREDSAFILRLIETAARHKLWLNIHDEYLPDGSARRHPHVLSCEAGAGSENKPTLTHDLTLPFTRGLAGPFDYAPLLYSPGRSNAHQIGYLLVFYNPAPVIRGGFSAWNPPGGRGGIELEFLRELPDTWDETRVLAGEIGRHLAVARRSGSRWFIGAVAAEGGAHLSLSLDFLPPGPHQLVRFCDAVGEGTECAAARDVATVNRTEPLAVTLSPGGGFAGWIEIAL
ncbi:MAG: glycoside hydrolase family 97 catalytic domain-containing protein [Verrucomicrobiae bacterium]|nr:glycoside hydrolase family 97 catalytic domain-containing protein [Verrucomicrobiae bacterium]